MRKLLVLLESGLLFVGLCVGLAAWQQQRALEQPLQLTEERLLDVSSGSTPGGMLARLEQEKVLMARSGCASTGVSTCRARPCTAANTASCRG